MKITAIKTFSLEHPLPRGTGPSSHYFRARTALIIKLETDAGISGWGWLEHGSPGNYMSSSDWIFTAESIPAPPALAVIGLGLLLGRLRHPR